MSLPSAFAKGPRKNTCPFLGVEAPAWPGARREHTGSIRPRQGMVQRRPLWDGSAVKKG